MIIFPLISEETTIHRGWVTCCRDASGPHPGMRTRSTMTWDMTAVFSSLLTSDSESKTNIVKVIRSILRENFRRHIKCELPLEKTCKDRLVPLKNRVPVSAKLGENFVFMQEIMGFSVRMYVCACDTAVSHHFVEYRGGGGGSVSPELDSQIHRVVCEGGGDFISRNFRDILAAHLVKCLPSAEVVIPRSWD